MAINNYSEKNNQYIHSQDESKFIKYEIISISKLKMDVEDDYLCFPNRLTIYRSKVKKNGWIWIPGYIEGMN